MGNSKFKDKILTLLKEDHETRELILEISSKNNSLKTETDKNEIEKYKEEIEMLKGLVEKWQRYFKDEESKTSNLTENINNKDKELKNLEQQKQKLRAEIAEIEKTKSSLTDELTLYKTSFEQELEHYKLYSQLSQSTKDSLKGIFKTDSLQGFLASGVQEKNISSLWDYIHNELKEGKNCDIEALKNLFYLFFKKYTLAYPLYKFQAVKVGDDFDIDEHIKDTSSSSVSGSVKEVIFKGWVNSRTQKSIRKTVVKVA